MEPPSTEERIALALERLADAAEATLALARVADERAAMATAAALDAQARMNALAEEMRGEVGR